MDTILIQQYSNKSQIMTIKYVLEFMLHSYFLFIAFLQLTRQDAREFIHHRFRSLRDRCIPTLHEMLNFSSPLVFGSDYIYANIPNRIGQEPIGSKSQDLAGLPFCQNNGSAFRKQRVENVSGLREDFLEKPALAGDELHVDNCAQVFEFLSVLHADLERRVGSDHLQDNDEMPDAT